jgi:hypothetical protein
MSGLPEIRVKWEAGDEREASILEFLFEEGRAPLTSPRPDDEETGDCSVSPQADSRG